VDLPHAERGNPEMGSAHREGAASKPTVRKAEIPSGRGKDREANAGHQLKGKEKS